MKKVMVFACTLLFIPAYAEHLNGQKDPDNPLRRQLLYAPHRDSYMQKAFPKTDIKPNKKKCVFCDEIKENIDIKNFILSRFNHNAVFMNLFPYQQGHLLVIPYDHVKNLENLNLETRQELIEIISAIPGIFKKALDSSGANIGINIGEVAGASKPDHLHVHALPRFGDDHLAYIQLLGETIVVHWDMNKLYEKLKPHFDKLKARLCN